MKTSTGFTKGYLSILILISFFLIAFFFVRNERGQEEIWLILEETVLGAESEAVVFSIQDGADSSYVLRAIRTGDAVLIPAGSLYKVVQEFDSWALVELVDRRRLFVAKKQKYLPGSFVALGWDTSFSLTLVRSTATQRDSSFLLDSALLRVG